MAKLAFTVILLIAAWATGGAGLTIALAPQSQSEEYQVKAAFLYNFAKFVEWPAEALDNGHTPMSLCVVGEDPFGDILEQTVQDKTVNGRPLAIKRLKAGPELRACHILFISSSEKKRLGQIIEAIRGASVLTVSETEGFIHQGPIINFIIEENKVRFEINLTSAERARLKISSKLLTLAKSLWSGSPGGRD
jgi:hypothetical protein